jgi:cysteine synthase A
MGFRTVIVIPETQSQEKKDMLRLAGAELVEVPAVPYKNPNNYVHYSQRLAERLNMTEPQGAIWANQFDNTANRQAHAETTGPEIWQQTEGKVDGFICAVGSGGTLGGVAQSLQHKGVKIGLVDPMGSALHAFYTDGVLKSEGSSITEGIGQGRITANLADLRPDYSFRVPDSEAIPIVFDMLDTEGLCLGGSSGLNIAGAIRMARGISQNCSIQHSCAKNNCRCRLGWNPLRIAFRQFLIPDASGLSGIYFGALPLDLYVRGCGWSGLGPRC